MYSLFRSFRCEGLPAGVFTLYVKGSFGKITGVFLILCIDLLRVNTHSMKLFIPRTRMQEKWSDGRGLSLDTPQTLPDLKQRLDSAYGQQRWTSNPPSFERHNGHRGNSGGSWQQKSFGRGGTNGGSYFQSSFKQSC